ncbi:MAG: NADH-quinone oxidoreductase subunit NuoG [Capsulimonadaceae bacterium]|nr:NADH-quinone oxidoreductase subunit NuoG [Capsulimonadaceae bacterium]
MAETITQAPETVNLTIDGKKVTVPKGTLLITAAFQAGADVPYFCHHPRLKPAGACRMCLVRIEKMAKLQTACTVPVSEGMVVDTLSPEVKQAQQGILEFLLINHPLDCPICDRGGECPLQNMTFQYGPGVTRFIDEKRHFPKPVPLNDYVSIDRERCIQCSRCTRFQAEIAGDGALAIESRGNSAVIAPFSLDGFQSHFSGNTVELCPVGALLSRPYRFQSRPWEFHSTDSVCSMCGVGCNIAVQTRTNQLMRVNSRLNEDVNEEWTCDTGKFEQYWVNSEERITTPMIRRASVLKPCSWDEALTAVAEAFSSAAKSSSNTVAGIGSTRTSNEEAYLFQRIFRTALGSNNIDHRMHDFPIRPMETSLAAIGEAKAIVAIGFDPKQYLPVVWLRIYKAISNGNATYAHVSSVDDPAVEAALAVGEGAILLTDDHIASADLDKLTKRAKSAGAKINVLLPDNNSWGAILMGVLPDRLPSLQPVGNGARPKFEALWGGPVPDKPGLATWDILKAGAAGDIRALYVLGSNPVASFPDRDLAASALEKIPFVVVQDLFLSESAQYANVFLPASSFIEKAGTFTNIEGRVQPFGAAIRPVGDSKPDWQILSELYARLGASAPFFGPADIAREIAHSADKNTFAGDRR